jgi:hypothetical protein
MALFAGAFDERVALTIPQESGGGGAPSWRVTDEIEPGGASEDIQRTDYNWFAGQMRQFANQNVYKLPTDHDELMAMVAPRALLETGNTDFYWLSNRSNYVSARATQQIYNTFGIGDRFGFYIDGGHQHCATLPAEAPAVTSFVNKFMLGQTGANSDVEVLPTGPTYDYSNLDTSRWTSWWGGDPNNDPPFPNQWNTGGTVVMQLDPGLNALLINTGDTVKGGYQLQIPGNHPDATVSVVKGNVQTDVRCFDGSSYTLTIPLTPNQSYTIPGKDSSWVPGPGLLSPDMYQGSATTPGCSSGASPGFLQGVYFSALNTSTAVGNPPTGTGLTTTDPNDPLRVKVSCTVNDITRVPSTPLTVNFQQ